jgi:hypothetical protein
MKAIWLCGIIIAAATSAEALELKVGDRIPAVSGEAVIVRNDGGVRHGTTVLDFGNVCHVGGWARNWFVVRRIVAGWTLLELVGPSPDENPVVAEPSFLAPECPLGTEMTRPTAEVRARWDGLAKDMEQQLLQTLTHRTGSNL